MNFKKLAPAMAMAKHEQAESPAKEQREEAAASDGGSYLHEEAPTQEDTNQSFVHHLDSVRYNAKHAAAHHEEAAKHASALMRLAGKVPSMAKHVERVK